MYEAVKLEKNRISQCGIMFAVSVCVCVCMYVCCVCVRVCLLFCFDQFCIEILQKGLPSIIFKCIYITNIIHQAQEGIFKTLNI